MASFTIPAATLLIDYPGAFDTRAYAVNDAGWVVGAYGRSGRLARVRL